MQKSESSSTLVDTLDLVEIIQKTENITNSDQQELKDTSINIETKDLPNSLSSTPIHKTKTRSRLSSAFRSLRGKKSEILSKDLNKEVLSSGGEDQDTTGAAIQVKKKSKLSKKFSLGGIKKHKIVPKKPNLVASSATQTQGTLERQVLNFGKSESSLVDLLSDCEDSTIKQDEFISDSPQLDEGSPTNFEKIRKIQITIQGKKIEYNPKIINTADLPTSKQITGSPTQFLNEEDYLTQTIDNSNKDPQKKVRSKDLKPAITEAVLITEHPLDIPPQEQAPAKPERSLFANSSISPKSGAIKKLTPQKERSEFKESELMKKEPINERGRRFPKPSVTESITSSKTLTPVNQIPAVSKEDISSQSSTSKDLDENTQSGNSLKNPNLSGSIVEQKKETVNIEIDNIQHKESSTKESSLNINKSQDTIESMIESQNLSPPKEPIAFSGIDKNSFDPNLLDSMPAFGDLTMDNEEPLVIMTATPEKREHLYKILVIGELGTGKTSFIKRYVHQFFSQNYRATIGVDFALKVLHWDQNTIVRLQLWDIAGQERFGNMTRVYYKEAVGAFIVFDVTRSGTFDCVAKWKEDLDSKVQLPDGSPIPCILLANKCDQDKQGTIATSEKMDEYVKENKFAGWYETSAKENINIDEAARALVNKILLNDKLISDADIADSERFNLDSGTKSPTTAQTIKNKCSC